MKRVLLLSLILAISLRGAYCQKIYSVSGSSKVMLEDYLSREETLEIAREQAKHAAIESVFGSLIVKDAIVDIEKGESTVTIKSNSELKGEWLKTTRESFREEIRKVRNETGKGKNTEIWIVCEIEGKVREITFPMVNLDAKPLKCPDLDCATTDFQNGDSFFLYLRSPVDGYLSIYLADHEHAYRILPYSEMPEEYFHNVPVIADREYILFHPDKSSDYFENFPNYYADEILLDSEKEQEYYKLYMIFSPEPFGKPILEDEIKLAGEYKTPNYLSRRHFDVWVRDNRIFDTNFYFQTLNLRVRK